MSKTNCLNCGKVLTDKFCSGCGQKADTHRITFKNFIFHDVLHGTFHLDKGILFTAKQALTRPGQAALDYISGKRKPFYNVFYLILITIGLIIFLHHYYDVLQMGKGIIIEPEKYPNEASRKIDQIFAEKSKILILLFVPFTAINSFILFRRKKLNLSEHAILAGMILLGMLLLSLIGNLLFYLRLIIDSNTLGVIINYLTISLIFFLMGYGYYNAFRNEYSKWGMTYRILLFFVMLSIEICILIFILIGIVTNWKMGTVRISPF
jgi:hypothetical protein